MVGRSNFFGSMCSSFSSGAFFAALPLCAPAKPAENARHTAEVSKAQTGNDKADDFLPVLRYADFM
jgi:hypothetical protein